MVLSLKLSIIIILFFHQFSSMLNRSKIQNNTILKEKKDVFENIKFQQKNDNKEQKQKFKKYQNDEILGELSVLFGNLQLNQKNGIEEPKYIKKSQIINKIEKIKINNFQPMKNMKAKLFKKIKLKNLDEKQLLEPIKDMVVNERLASANTNVRKVENIFEDKKIFRINLNNEKENEQQLEITDEFKIIWEIGMIKKQLQNKGKINLLGFYKKLIQQADAILKKYIRVKKGEIKNFHELPDIEFFKGYNRNINFPKGHLILVVSLIDINDGTIAQARLISQKSSSKRATVGFLELNIKESINERDSGITQQRYILTLVHEILHVVAFNKNLNPQEILNNQRNDTGHYYENLKEISNNNDLSIAYQQGHWQENILPNDFMTPISRKNQILTIYTLEMIENYCHKYHTYPEYLPSNWFMDSIDSKVDFMNYQCDDRQTPKYSTYCSALEKVKQKRGCSGDFLHKTYCDFEQQENRCYLNVAFQNGTCIDSTLQGYNTKYEKFGINSRCTETDQGISMCIEYRIDQKKVNNEIKYEIYMIFNEQEFLCQENEQKHEIGKIKLKSTKNTHLICPNLEKFLTFYKKTNCPDFCNDNGFCSDGKCICYEGYEESTNCKTQKNISKNLTTFTEGMQLILKNNFKNQIKVYY